MKAILYSFGLINLEQQQIENIKTFELIEKEYINLWRIIYAFVF